MKEGGAFITTVDTRRGRPWESCVGVLEGQKVGAAAGSGGRLDCGRDVGLDWLAFVCCGWDQKRGGRS